MAKKLKIAFLNIFSGINNRGVESIIEELSIRINKQHEVIVFEGGQETKKYRTIHVPINWNPTVFEEKLNLKRRLFFDETSRHVKKFTKDCIPLIKNGSFDIVVSWNSGLQPWVLRKSGIKKIVVVGESGIGWDDRISLLSFPNCFVGLTDYQCQWVRKVNPAVKVVKIPNGVDLDKFKPVIRKLKAPPLILNVGALVAVKRQDLIIKAVSGIDSCSLTLVGRGELKDKLEQLAKKLIPGRFKIFDLPYSQIRKVYNSADVFTFPTSAWESFGVVLLEAMATNLPIVTNDDPIRREIVGEAGLYVNPTNTKEYSETLKRVLSINWGDRPRKQAEKFSWDNIADQYIELFESL